MKKLLLLAAPGELGPAGNDLKIAWSGRQPPAGTLSLEQELDRCLLQIRAEHMAWAYDAGWFKTGAGAELQQMLSAGQTPSMWWTSLLYERHPKLSPQLFPIYKLRCLELLAEQNNCAAIELHGGDSLLLQALRQLCAARGWKFQHRGKTARPRALGNFLTRLYNWLPAPFRAIIRFWHWHFAIYGKIKAQKLNARPISGKNRLPATIVSYFPNIDLHAAGQGRFRSRYWESLHDALNRQAHFEDGGSHFVNWLFIRFPEPGLTFAQCRRLVDLFQKEQKDGLNFNYLEQFLARADLVRCLKRWLGIALSSHKLKAEFGRRCNFKNSGLNFWPYIRKQWQASFQGWRCLERCLQNQAFKNYFSQAGKLRWTLFPLENCPWERMLTVACREYGSGPVYGAQHSIIRPTDFRYFDDPRTFANPVCAAFQPDIFGGNGESATGQWQANKMPAERLRQLEALRYLYLAGNEAGGDEVSELPPQAGEPLMPENRPRLLVVTSFFADETAAHLDLLGQALDKGLLQGWAITIKPHPYLAVDNWLQKRPESQQGQIRLASGPISLELAPGVLVWASNSTTVALEAALRHLPLMVMQPCNDFDLCPIQNVPGLWRTGTVSDVENGLAQGPLTLPADYLDLNPGLQAWRELLKLDYASGN